MSPASSHLPHVLVTAAVVEEDECFLVTRRPSGVHLAGYWEFPGGKCEAGESDEDCLRREMREELETDVRVGELLSHIVHAYPERTLELKFYRCQLTGTAVPLLGQEIRWARRDELATLSFPPADRELIARLTKTAT